MATSQVIQANDTVQFDRNPDGPPDLITVPDLKFTSERWNAVILTATAFLFQWDGWAVILWGPVTVGPNTFYLATSSQSGFDAELIRLLGGSNVWELKSELRLNNGLRTSIKARIDNGQIKHLRNSLNEVVGIVVPHVIAGQSPVAAFLGDEDIETAAEILGLE